MKRRPAAGEEIFLTEAYSGIMLRGGVWVQKCVKSWAGIGNPRPGEWKEHCWYEYHTIPPSRYGSGDRGEEESGCTKYEMCHYDGGSGTSGGGSSPTIPLHANLNKLFKGVVNLANCDIDKLNRAYEEMRRECFYEYIDNYLSANNVRLGKISIGNTSGQAAIDENGNLSFYDYNEITAENLKHEWIHLFQRQYHHLTSFGNKAGMMEFELALAQDILFFIEIQGDWPNHAHSWAAWKTKQEKYQKEYMNWLKEITTDGRGYPTAIDNIKFQYFSEVFGEISRSYHTNKGYVYGNHAYSSSAIQALFNQAKKHCNK